MIQNPIKKMFFMIIVILVLFIAGLLQVTSQKKTLISELEITEFTDDDESQNLLKEYYGELIGYVGVKDKFNTIASKGDIAILNVTINGKDRRIITRLKKATLFSGQSELADPLKIKNLIVTGDITLKGILYADIEEEYGGRNLFGVDSTTSRYVDEGYSRIINGQANISINPILRDLIDRYNIFLTAEGLTKGIYVSQKTKSYFVVKSANPNSNVGFSWMLRGVRNGFRDKYLNSKYGQELGIKISASINTENGKTNIRIEGLKNIFKLTNTTTINRVINNYETINGLVVDTNESSKIVETKEENLTLVKADNLTTLGSITGQIIDEFGLETDLSNILGEPADLTGVIGNSGETVVEETPIIGETVQEEIVLNETVSQEVVEVGVNDSVRQEAPVLEFTINSIDENYILDQIVFVTGLNLQQIKMLVEFVYEEPIAFEDEIIEDMVGYPEGIEKINGSVIIRVG